MTADQSSPSVTADATELAAQLIDAARDRHQGAHTCRTTEHALLNALDAALAREQRLREALENVEEMAEADNAGSITRITRAALSRPAPEQP